MFRPNLYYVYYKYRVTIKTYKLELNILSVFPSEAPELQLKYNLKGSKNPH